MKYRVRVRQLDGDDSVTLELEGDSPGDVQIEALRRVFYDLSWRQANAGIPEELP